MNTNTNTTAGATASHYLTTSQAAKYLGISAWVLRRMAYNHEIKHYKPTAGRYKFRVSDLDAYMQQNAVEVI